MVNRTITAIVLASNATMSWAQPHHDEGIFEQAPNSYAVALGEAHTAAIEAVAVARGYRANELAIRLGDARLVVDGELVTVVGPIEFGADCLAVAVERTDLARCFVRRFVDVFGGDTGTTLASATVNDVGPDGVYIGHLNQLSHGVPVIGRGISIVASDTHVYSIAGRISDSNDLPVCTAPPGADMAIEPTSRRCLFRAQTERGAEYSDELGRPVAVDKTFANVSVTRSVKTNIYSDSHVFSPTFGTTTEVVPLSCFDTLGGVASCYAASGSNCAYNMKEEAGTERMEVVKTILVGGIATESPITENGSCPNGPWISPSEWPEAGANAYANLRKLRAMKNHESSYMTHIAASEPLTINIQEPALGGDEVVAGYYTSGDNQIGLRHDYPYAYDKDLYTIAHEYGHYLEDMIQGFSLSGPASEGWANSVPLRYIVYNDHITQAWSGSYGMSIMGFSESTPGRHSQISRNGERVHGAYSGTVNEQAFYYSAGCSGSVYFCGDTISQVYWELAWNVCRTSFGTCGSGASIVQAGSYASAPWRLANSAFSNALDPLASGAGVASYFAQVESMYSTFLANGYLDNSSFERVRSVLAHHCVGSTASCASGFKLPGSPLPALGTWKVRALEGEGGSATGSVFNVSSTGTSNNGYARFWLSPAAASNYTIPLALSFPASVPYKAKVAARCYSAPCQIQIKVNGAIQGNNLVVPASWSWIDSNAVTLAGNQSHTISVVLLTGAVDVDFVTLEPN